MLRTIADNMADSVVVVTADGTVRYANSAAEALLRRPGAELVGAAFPHPMIDSDLSLGDGRVGEMRVTAIDWDGQPAQLAVIRDVSRREELRALERELFLASKRSAMAQLAASVAHEINNPTAFLLANLTVMRDIIADFESVFAEARLSRKLMDRYQVTQSLTDMRDMLADNSLGLDRIRGFIRELRAMIQEPLESVALLDVNSVVAQACDLVASTHGSELRIVRELGEVPAIAADRLGVTQIVVNLLENAIAAMRQVDDGHPESAGRVEVTTRSDGDWLHVAVRDHGCGIHEDRIGALFEPLLRARRPRRSVGLGLTIAAEIASSHGGRIDVHSTPGQGSTFCLVLPRDTGLPLSSDVPEMAPDHVRARVLLVTTNSELRRRVHALLDPFHDVHDAESGQDAAGRAGGYDVLLCDLVSCASDAMALHRSLLESEPVMAARMVLLGGAQAPPRIKRFIETSRAITLQGPLSGPVLREVIERMTR